jgi:hypothetical protein
MPGIKALNKLISDDVCVNLAQLAIGGQTGIGTVTNVGTITNVDRSTPMNVTTSTPHGLLTGDWVTIFGCNGTQNPGGVPASQPAFDLSINGAWQVLVTGATTFQVSDGVRIDPAGIASPVAVTPGAPNGYYASGGTVVRGPLPEGHILLGQQHIAENSYAPRIVAMWRRSEWPDKGMYSPSTASPPPDLQQQKLARSLLTERYVIEYHVWAQQVPPDPEGGDKDVAQIIYQQIIRSVDQMARGSWDILPGGFTKEQPNATNLMAAGEEFVFVMKIGSPVPETLLEPVPAGTSIRFTFSPDPSTG